MVDWNSLEGLPPHEAAKRLTAVLDAIDKALAAQPHLRENVVELLARQLESTPLDAETFDRVVVGLGALLGLGDDPAQLLWWIAFMPDERLEAVASESSPAVERLLREAFAVYGRLLADAVRRYHELPENWAWFRRDIYHDIIEERYRIDLTITKFNDEKVRLTCSPDSLLTLLSNVVLTLNSLASTDPFNPALVEDVRRELDVFWDTLSKARANAQGAVTAEGAPGATAEA